MVVIGGMMKSMLGVGVLTLIAMLASAVEVLSQETQVEVGVGFRLGHAVLTGCAVDDCTPVAKGVVGEVAKKVTDRVAVAGRTAVSFSDLGPYGSARGVDLDGGVRIYGPLGRVRVFVQLMAGLTTATVTATTFGGSESFVGLGLSPGSGVEMDVGGGRAGLRMVGEWTLNRVEGESINSLRVMGGLIVRVGNR